jgi:hypothetical protein
MGKLWSINFFFASVGCAKVDTAGSNKALVTDGMQAGGKN